MLDGFLEGIAKERLTREEFLDLLLADQLLDTLAFEPGSRFAYSNTNYLLAAECAAGRPYGRLVRERIFEPLGMKESGVYDDLLFVPRLAFLYEQPPEGVFAPAARTVYSSRSGALTTTARDLYRWHRALQDGALLGKEGASDPEGATRGTARDPPLRSSGRDGLHLSIRRRRSDPDPLLLSKGEPILIEPGMRFLMETASLQLEAHVLPTHVLFL